MLAAGLTSFDKLQIMLSVAMYPDALQVSELVSLQSILDSISSVSSFNEADMYVQIVSYLSAAADALGVDIAEYIRNKLVTAAGFMNNILPQPEYHLNQNNLEYRMVNSDNYFKDILLNSQVPLLNFTMALWKVNYYYKLLETNTYKTTLYPYGLAFFLPNSSWYYY